MEEEAMNASAYVVKTPLENVYSNSASFLESSLTYEKHSLKEAIRELIFFAEVDNCSAPSLDTLLAALQMVTALPENKRLPKISLDGDGDVLLMWEGPGGQIRLGITVQGQTLSAVANPGVKSEHFNPIVFRGYFPPAILAHVPTR
jgi:hypothetical protein